MKTHAILINKDLLHISSFTDINMTDIHNYINHKLHPFQSIGVFSFNNYSNIPPFIDGKFQPNTLIETTIAWSNIRKKIILQLASKKSNINLIQPSSSEKRLLNFACGYFQYENQFFNCITNSSNLFESEINTIKIHPENYGIFFTNLYK